MTTPQDPRHTSQKTQATPPHLAVLAMLKTWAQSAGYGFRLDSVVNGITFFVPPLRGRQGKDTQVTVVVDSRGSMTFSALGDVRSIDELQHLLKALST